MIGNSPLHLKIFGDTDGTFHDFGSYYYVIRALPIATNQYLQTRVFRTGHLFTPEDHIPQRIDFDMNQPYQVGPPGYGYPAYPPAYYGPPVYYGPPGYYAPGIQFYFGPGSPTLVGAPQLKHELRTERKTAELNHHASLSAEGNCSVAATSF